ncbi:alpha/beta fold hydrolase [Aminobacter sp. BA135]|uniref:alpha/beta fold hydrolase n=1 Tax=Aminobacter sp. BA135 TaxID=537596 RepID=UPI003D79CAF4
MQALIEGYRNAGMRVISLDLPGHGGSLGRALDMAKAVEAATLAGQWFGPFEAIVGHSFGGAVAVNAAAGTSGVRAGCSKAVGAGGRARFDAQAIRRFRPLSEPWPQDAACDLGAGAACDRHPDRPLRRFQAADAPGHPDACDSRPRRQGSVGQRSAFHGRRRRPCQAVLGRRPRSPPHPVERQGRGRGSWLSPGRARTRHGPLGAPRRSPGLSPGPPARPSACRRSAPVREAMPRPRHPCPRQGGIAARR